MKADIVDLVGLIATSLVAIWIGSQWGWLGVLGFLGLLYVLLSWRDKHGKID